MGSKKTGARATQKSEIRPRASRQTQKTERRGPDNITPTPIPKPKNPLQNTKGLTLKQRKLIKARAEGKSLQEAGVIAGMSAKSAQQQACMELKKPEVAEAFEQLAEKLGLGKESVVASTVNLMMATKTVSAIGGKDANAGTVDFIEVPDNPTRLGATKLGAQLLRMLDENDVKFQGDININVIRYGGADGQQP